MRLQKYENSICLAVSMSGSVDYHNLDSHNSLGGSVTTVKTTMSQEGLTAVKEGFLFTRDSPASMDMTTNIQSRNLITTWTGMSADPVYDLSTNVVDPYGYGYVPSLEETRNQDALNLLQQENSLFVMGAIAGVSMIVLGIVMAASASSASTPE